MPRSVKRSDPTKYVADRAARAALDYQCVSSFSGDGASASVTSGQVDGAPHPVKPPKDAR